MPISLHGDGVPVTGVGRSWSKSYDALTWTSCVASGDTVSIFNFIVGLFKDAACVIDDKETWDEILKKLVWSFRALLRGEWPDRDDNGVLYRPGSQGYRRRRKPLCGEGREKFKAVIVLTRADLDFFFKSMHMQNFNLAREPCNPCNHCNANVSTRSWRDLREAAACFLTCWTAESWNLQFAPHPCHLFELEGFTIYNLLSDLMHTNHLGDYQQMLGSTLHFLVHHVMPGGAASENMRTVVGQCKAFWRLNPTPNRFQDIKLSMLRSSTAYPTLKGRAAEIKHLVRALRDVWSIHREDNRASDEYVLHAQIALLLQKFDEMDSALDAHDPINYPCLPPGPQADFEKACWDAMYITNFLGHFLRMSNYCNSIEITMHFQ